MRVGKGQGEGTWHALTSLLQDCRRPSQEHSLPIPHDWSLRRLVLGWAALSLSDTGFTWEPTTGPAPAGTTAARATEGQRWLCSRRKDTGLARRNETTSLTSVYLRQPLTPTSMVRTLIVLKDLQLYFTSWSLPWTYQKDEYYHIQMQKDIGPRVVRTHLFRIGSLPVGTGETSGRGVRAPW